MKPDITITSCGAIAVLTGETPAGLDWIRANLYTEGWQWFGPSIAVDARYADAIIEGAMGDDLRVAA